MTAGIRIILVDDQELVRTGFRMVLEAQPDMIVVGEAADGLAAVEAVRRQPADVVVMDVRMPRLDGVEATRRICADAGAAGTSECWTGALGCAALLAGALPSGGAASGFMFGEVRAAAEDEAAGAELAAPDITPSVCCAFGVTP